jgi:hypothetical protein
MTARHEAREVRAKFRADRRQRDGLARWSAEGQTSSGAAEQSGRVVDVAAYAHEHCLPATAYAVISQE